MSINPSGAIVIVEAYIFSTYKFTVVKSIKLEIVDWMPGYDK